MSEQRAVAITGTNGYVGSSLRESFVAAGYRVVGLQRRLPADIPEQDHIPFTLEGGPTSPLPDDVSAVVHCAYDLQARDRADIDRINIGGTRKLLEKVGSVPVVCISSMSAYPGTRQIYGQTKLVCEEMVAEHGGTSLRLGLVYGGGDRGMIGTLRRVAELPFVPQLRPDPYQYTVHVDDMVRCVIAAVEREPIGRPVLGVAHPRRVPFAEIIETLRTTNRKRRRFIPVPSAALYRALNVAEGAGVPMPFRADSMLGLMYPAAEVPFVDYWAGLGITLRDFPRSMS